MLEHLADGSQGDIVYKALLERAAAEPVRFRPSPTILAGIDAFCAQASVGMGKTSPQLCRSLAYLQAQVSRLSGKPATRATSDLNEEGSSAHSAASSQGASAGPTPAAASVSSATGSSSSRTKAPTPAWTVHSNMLEARFVAPAAQSTSPGTTATAEGPPRTGPAAAIQEHVRTIVNLKRAQTAQQAAQTQGKVKMRDNRPRLLFQYLPYSQQEPLQMSQLDIAALVEAVCGAAGASGVWGGFSSDMGGKRDEAAQICASILVKLVMDMVLKAGTAVALPLALVLLHRSVSNPSMDIRCRAFDFIYNLSLHAELVHPPPAEPAKAEDVPLSPSASPPELHGWPLPAGLDQKVEDFREWLRSLLWELSHLLAQRREQRSAVWSSVLGCLLHLCTYNGRLVRAFLEGLSMRAVRALLHCSLRDHWAPDVHRQLISLAVALMYMPQEEQPGERRLPFAVSPRGPPAAKLQLSQQRLTEFGGMREVVHQFKAAPCSESRCNMLSVMLDHVAWNLSEAHAAEQGVGSPAASPKSADYLLPVQQLLRQLARPWLADAVHIGFCVGEPRLVAAAGQAAADSHMQALSGSPASPASHSGLPLAAADLLPVIMEQLEACATADAHIEGPPELEAAVADTLTSVRMHVAESHAKLRTLRRRGHPKQEAQQESPGRPGTEPKLTGHWTCLVDLLCGSDAWGVRLGQQWLHNLLVTAAETNLVHSHLPQQAGLALLPPLSQQDVDGNQHVQPALCFMQVVERLLLYVHVQCAGSSGMGAAAAHRISFDSEDDEVAVEDVRLDIAASSDRNPAVWQGRDSSSMVLHTLMAALRWVREKCDGDRFGACMLSTHLLLRLCCMPAKSAMGRAGADQVQQMLGSTVAGSAGSHLPAEPPASAFLKGSAAVPRSTLNQMPPQLLVGLFQELSSQEPQPQL
eukprot:jgi/Astpho2/7033/Aster-x1415